MDLDHRNIDLLWTIYSIGYLYTALILPGLAYRALIRRTRGRNRFVIVVGVVVVTWIALNVYRERTFVLRMFYQEMLDPGNTNDGQAGDALLFLLGWLPPVLSMVLFDVFGWFFRKLNFSPQSAARA